MSAKVYLTPAERSAAAEAAQKAIDRGKRHFGVVEAVINAINANRKDSE
jgi:hypothetical protein